MSNYYYVVRAQGNIGAVTDCEGNIFPSRETLIMDLSTGRMVDESISVYDCENAVVLSKVGDGYVNYNLMDYTERGHVIDYSDDCVMSLNERDVIIWYKGHVYTNKLFDDNDRGTIVLKGLIGGIGRDSIYRNSLVHYENGRLYGYNSKLSKKEVLFKTKGDEMSKAQFKRMMVL